MIAHIVPAWIAGRGEGECPEIGWVEPTKGFHGKPHDWQILSTAHPQFLSSSLSTSYPFLSLSSHHLLPIVYADCKFPEALGQVVHQLPIASTYCCVMYSCAPPLSVVSRVPYWRFPPLGVTLNRCGSGGAEEWKR